MAAVIRRWIAEAVEITNLNSKARVVVLPYVSTTQTQSGNAFMALSWAWFVAGTPAVELRISCRAYMHIVINPDYTEFLRIGLLSVLQLLLQRASFPDDFVPLCGLGLIFVLAQEGLILLEVR